MRKAAINNEKPMKIGQVARLADVGVETIRFYERAGVLPEPKRRPSGYRLFDMQTVAQIQFIKKVQEMGFSLTEAGNLASGKGIPQAINQIERQIADLRELQRELMKRLKGSNR